MSSNTSIGIQSKVNLVRNNMAKMYGTDLDRQRLNTDALNKAQESTELHAQDIKDRIEKGQLADMFVYGYGSNSKPLVFVKTGKEIKGQLPTITTHLNAEIAKLTIAKAVLVEKIGFEPDSTTTYWQSTTVHPCYSDDVCYPQNDTTDNSIKQWAREYNRIQSQESGIKDDLTAISVISNNLEDSKKYELSTSQLVALKFQ